MCALRSVMDDAFRYKPTRPGEGLGMTLAAVAATALVVTLGAVHDGTVSTVWGLLIPLMVWLALWIMAPTVKWSRRLRNYKAYLRQFRRAELREALQSDLDSTSREVIRYYLQREKRRE